MDSTDSDNRTGQRFEHPRTESTFSRILKYSLAKGASLLVTVAIGMYLTILVVNLGGYIDQMRRGQIFEAVGARLMSGWLKDTPPDERLEIVNQTIWQIEESQGLHQPFLSRTFRWFLGSLIFDFGDNGATRGAVLNALPYTATLVGLTNLAIFIVGLILALILSRRPDSRANRLVTILSPLTFAPAWVYGAILLTLDLLLQLQLPTPGSYLIFRKQITPFSLKYMVIPILAIFLSTFFQGVFTWRAFFQLYSQEDYIELAKAQGLSNARIERSYILRPTLPYVITNFALMAITLWQEAIALEYLFKWPGIGALFINTVSALTIPYALGTVIIFAYMLASTVFILDVLYALVDPRVRVGGGNSQTVLRLARPRMNIFRRIFHRERTAEIYQVRTRSDPFIATKERVTLAQRLQGLKDALKGLFAILAKFRRYPSAIVGSIGILFMVGVSIYTLIAVPYETAVELWRGQSRDFFQNFWSRNPVNVPPAWFNWFSSKKLPLTIDLNSQSGRSTKTVTAITADMTEISMPFTFEYNYDAFPSEINLFFRAQYDEKLPLINLAWYTPDNREIDFPNFTIRNRTTYYLSADQKIIRKLNGEDPQQGLFTNPAVKSDTPIKGTYRLVVTAYVFEPDADVDVDAVFYGQVHGLVGTDANRRDPMMGLLWGTTICLALGLLGAIGTSLTSMTLAAVGVWYSGWLDGLIQRVTEVNLIIPKILFAILVYVLYSKSIWVIMGVIVVLNIFGSTIKNYRAVFLQIKDSPYIEAARVYGASHRQIIWRYMVPRILPSLIPQMVTLVPAYVYYESTLALLKVRDPYLPTWGKIIYDAYINGAMMNGHWYQILFPIALLALTGMAFALVGNALEYILNPSTFSPEEA